MEEEKKEIIVVINRLNAAKYVVVSRKKRKPMPIAFVRHVFRLKRYFFSLFIDNNYLENFKTAEIMFENKNRLLLLLNACQQLQAYSTNERSKTMKKITNVFVLFIHFITNCYECALLACERETVHCVKTR